MSIQILLSVLSLAAMLTVATALPMHRRSESTVSENTTTNLLINAPSNVAAISMLGDLILSLPNCSYSNEIHYYESNRTYIDLQIGLEYVIKDYLQNISVSTHYACLLMQCYRIALIFRGSKFSRIAVF